MGIHARVASLAGGLLLAGIVFPAAAASWPPPAEPCAADAAASPAAFVTAFRNASPAVVRVLSVWYSAPGVVSDRAAASGFVVSADGLVLGSAHAVAGAAQTWIELRDGQQLQARIVGINPRLDLALMQVDAQGLPAIAVSAEDPRPGQWVAALGAPFGLEQSISAGMVSAYPRELPGVSGVGLIQTDVAINPGSSGGPLLNACGQVVGMSVMVFAARGLYVGITFAVPARRLLQAAVALLEGGPRAGSAGFRAQSVTPALARAFGWPGDEGAIVVRVEPGGAAAGAGLREGDIVLAMDGVGVVHADALAEALALRPPGGGAILDIWREGARRRVALRLQVAAPPQPPQSLGGMAQPRLGLQFGPHPPGSTPAPQGLHVAAADGASLLAGIEEGDCIAAVNGQRMATVADFDEALTAARKGGAHAVAVLIERDGVRIWLPVRLIEATDPGSAGEGAAYNSRWKR